MHLVGSLESWNTGTLADSLALETIKKSKEGFLVELPEAVFVGAGQGRAVGGLNRSVASALSLFHPLQSVNLHSKVDRTRYQRNWKSSLSLRKQEKLEHFLSFSLRS